MCGIAGFADPSGKVSAEMLEAASRAIAHRGPDDCGSQLIPIHGKGCAGLASRRLAIIDLSQAGHQPMRDSANGNWIVYNGEIFNYRELRAQLQADGAQFTSSTDTEVALKAYSLWGEDFMDRFRGMFAFAIWDAARQRLFLARDRLGIKPLYYHESQGMIFFASEVRALLATQLIPRRLNPPAVQQFLTFGSVSDPETMLQGILALPPGNTLTWERGRSTTREYWDLAGIASRGAERETGATEAAVLPRLESLIHESINLRMVSDVPVGVFLSGGIDSSAVVAVLSQDNSAKVNTFSVAAKDSEHDESPLSRSVARKFNTEHHEIDLAGSDFLEAVPEAISAMDQPSVDGFNTYVISREVRRTGLKVALSGLGGDELFAGYSTFRNVPRMEKLARLRGWMPSPLRSALSAALLRTGASDQKLKLAACIAPNGSPLHPYVLARSLFLPEQQKQMINPALRESRRWQTSISALLARSANLDPVNRISYLELGNYTANTLLRDTDCMSMANGLEVRVPFLDNRLVEYVLSVPGKLKIQNGIPKPLLVKALKGLLPDEIVYGPKRGFTLPFEHWLRHQLKATVETGLEKVGNGALSEIIDPRAAQAVWQNFLEGKTSWSRPWALYVLDCWCNTNL